MLRHMSRSSSIMDINSARISILVSPLDSKGPKIAMKMRLIRLKSAVRAIYPQKNSLLKMSMETIATLLKK